MLETKEQLDQIRAKIQDPDFQAGKGLSNEVNIHIYGYDPGEEMTIRHFVKQLEADKKLHCNLKSYNLYDVLLSIIEKKHIGKSVPKMEANKGPKFLLEKLGKVATVQAFVKEMDYGPCQQGDVLLLSGVGSVFPFMRVHSLLGAPAGIPGHPHRRPISRPVRRSGAQPVQPARAEQLLSCVQRELKTLAKGCRPWKSSRCSRRT